jgi:hypothetical protein
MCPCVRQQASWEAQVIKLCEIWANISDLQSGYKDQREQRVFGTGYDSKRESIEEDYYTDESGSSSR